MTQPAESQGAMNCPLAEPASTTLPEHGYRLSAVFVDRLGDLIVDLQVAGFLKVAAAVTDILAKVELTEQGKEIGHGYGMVQEMRGADGSGALPELRRQKVPGLRDPRTDDAEVSGRRETVASGTERC